jgi:hypothetical protein
MKKTLLALLLASSFAYAEQVTVTGYGATYNAALENAKVLALEKGASTFIIAENRARDGRVVEEIDQYNGGVIKTYTIVSRNSTHIGHEVEITADVVPKNNSMKRSSGNSLDIDFEDYDKRERVVQHLDNVTNAIRADVMPTSHKIGRYETTVYTNIVLSWQPKWISDMKSYASVVNKKGNTSNNIRDKVTGSSMSYAMTRFGTLGALASLGVYNITKPNEQPINQNMMVCFGGNECSSIDVDMTLPRNPKLVLVANISGQEVVLYEQYLDMKMYRYVPAGATVNNSIFRSYNVRYDQPALLIDEQKQTVPVEFNVPNDVIRHISTVNVFLR